ncbi:MAG TPA: hypothetical protein G4O00_03490 [Thermoflexia bacterium]|jgi:hypothetical protein|nr:hypothetical protein [Thermoflexia bacterium]
MRSRGVGLALALALGVALALLWAIGIQQEVATAAPAPAVEGAGASSVAPAATTYYVAPGGDCGVMTPCFATVQGAVDAAAPGDIILVASGFYTGVQQRNGITQVVYISKDITIRGGYTVTNWSTSDPLLNVTSLDSVGFGRVMVISGPITVHVEGLYIANGNASGLGGGPGGLDGAGGGVYVVGANVTISNCTFSGNVASSNGIGSGGGIYLWNANASLVNNEFLSNIASGNILYAGYGGGIAISGGSVTLERNYIHSNSANLYNSSGSGGGIYIDSGSPILINNVLIDNSAPSQGSAIYIGSASPHLLHTTIVSNTGGDGSGIYAAGSTVVLTNSIIVSQMVGVTTEINTNVTLNGVLWYGNERNTGGGGIVTVQNEVTGTPDFDIDGYHILSSSAALNAGVNAGVSGDIDGQDRPYGAAPDLGADEWWPTPITGVLILGSDIGFVDFPNFFNALALPWDAALPITYTWSPVPDGGQGTAWVTYTWSTTGTYVITLTAQNVSGSAITTTTITIRTDLTTTLYPTADITLIYTDPWGLTTTVYAPAGAVTQSLVLRYVPQPTYTYNLSPDWGFADHAFDLEVLSNELPLQGFVFSQPLTITVNYTDSDVAGLDENTLRLYFWDGSQWVDGATTCVPTSTYHLYTQENRLELAICHLSRWGMMGFRAGDAGEKKVYLYLPIVLRNYP